MNIQLFECIGNCLTQLNPRKVGGFMRRQRWGEGGFHRKSSNSAIRPYNALESWPYTSKFTIDHPEHIKTIFESIRDFSKFFCKSLYNLTKRAKALIFVSKN